jgi:hypothetical protein
LFRAVAEGESVMKRWWKRLAVVAAWLGVGVAAQAQGFNTGPHGAARMPEPLRYTPEPIPPLVNGPLTPQMAPMGPGPELSLPASHSSAFQLENYSTEAGFYTSLGTSFLRRYRAGNRGTPILFDPDQNLDTGFFSRNNLPRIADTGDVDHSYRWNGVFTLGYLYANHAIEFNGFYSPEGKNTIALGARGALAVPFGSPDGSFPIGFEGNNGLWRQADRVVMTFENSIGSAELIYRNWNPAVNGVDFIAGVRYLNLRERLGLLTEDDAFTTNEFGQYDVTRSAEYKSSIQTNFYGLTLGAETSAPLWQKRVWITGIAKGAWGVNQIQRTLELNRLDGLNAFTDRRTRVQFGQLYDTTLSLDFHLLEKARLRVGYQALWLLGTTTPGAQFELDFNQQGVRGFGSRDVFYHGPTLEFQMLF